MYIATNCINGDLDRQSVFDLVTIFWLAFICSWYYILCAVWLVYWIYSFFLFVERLVHAVQWITQELHHIRYKDVLSFLSSLSLSSLSPSPPSLLSSLSLSLSLSLPLSLSLSLSLSLPPSLPPSLPSLPPSLSLSLSLSFCYLHVPFLICSFLKTNFAKREVLSLHVRCHADDEGCKWHGELRNLDVRTIHCMSSFWTYFVLFVCEIFACSQFLLLPLPF